MSFAGFRAATAAALVVAGSSGVWAQGAGGAAAASPARVPVATASRTTEPPVIDGNLDEETWQRATPMTGFTQSDPLEGEPSSEPTNVRILYDDTALYVSADLIDSDPSGIVVTDTKRDSSLDDQDSFEIIFDTFRDRQNGFVFGTNSTGIQYDAQVRTQGLPSKEWDGSWDVKTQRTERGWTAEFRIPLRTLRYGASPQVWGVNFQRHLQRNREIAYWSPMLRQYTIGRLSSAGELHGLELKVPRNFKIYPYVIGEANRDYKFPEGDLSHAFGGDAKFGVTGSLNLDVTYNTDFAQVEVDTQQINVTRNNVRFPEKRPFFLENAELFKVGATPNGASSTGDLDLFFTRRIGLDDNGNIIPIIGGARLTGKQAGYNIGMLDMQTEQVGLKPGDNFLTARVSRDLPSRSGVGGIFVNRQAMGSRAGDDDWNRTYGLDGVVGAGERLTASGFLSRTQTPGLTGRQYGWNTTTEYNNGTTLVRGDYGIIGEDFNPEVGYLENSLGYKRWYARLEHFIRTPAVHRWGFRDIKPHGNYTRYDYLDNGGLQSGELHLDNEFNWENGSYLSTALNGTWEGFKEPFTVYPGITLPPGEYGGLRFTARANSDARKPLYGRYEWSIGRFLSGDQNSHLARVVIRGGKKFTVDSSWNMRLFDLPEGSFHTNLGNMRLTYNFTTSVFVQSLVQYNDRTQRWSTNLRFHWLQTAGTGLFVVYNDTESLEGAGPVNRAFIVKYVRQFDLLH